MSQVDLNQVIISSVLRQEEQASMLQDREEAIWASENLLAVEGFIVRE